MSRPVYILDTTKREYTERTNAVIDGVQYYYFEFRAPARDVAPLQNPRCIVTTPRGSHQFDRVAFERLPGPPVDKEHLYRVTLVRTWP